jgi:hypothetical protein
MIEKWLEKCLGLWRMILIPEKRISNLQQIYFALTLLVFKFYSFKNIFSNVFLNPWETELSSHFIIKT